MRCYICDRMLQPQEVSLEEEESYGEVAFKPCFTCLEEVSKASDTPPGIIVIIEEEDDMFRLY